MGFVFHRGRAVLQLGNSFRSVLSRSRQALREVKGDARLRKNEIDEQGVGVRRAGKKVC